MSLKIGLIGGLGWPATIAYYEAICGATRIDGAAGSPEMTIESLDMAKTLAARGKPNDDASWAAFDRIFQEALNNLHNSGCDIAAIASVTPHNRLASISEESPVQIVSIVDAVVSELAGCIAKDAVVLGTSVTMQGTLFDDALRQLGMNVRRAESAEITAHNELLEAYFYSGRADKGREALLQYIKSAFGSNDLLCILACTDLAPAFPDKTGQVLFDVDEITFCNATAAHVESILAATTGNYDQVPVSGL